MLGKRRLEAPDIVSIVPWCVVEYGKEDVCQGVVRPEDDGDEISGLDAHWLKLEGR
jgi:hypothetical protein